MNCFFSKYENSHVLTWTILIMTMQCDILVKHTYQIGYWVISHSA